MNVLFDIQGSGRASGGLLLCEWGEGYCCTALLESDTHLLHRLRYWSLDEPLPAAHLDSIIEGLRQWSAHAAHVVFCSAFPEAVLLPQRYAEGAAQMLPALFPVAGRMQQDRIGEWQLTTAYTFPPGLDAHLRAAFPDAQYYHAFTPALRSHSGIDAPTQMQVHFAPRQFRVLAKKDGFLQLAQVYRYETPLDVVYYLLRIAGETGLPGRDTPLVLSGLVDEESSLYRELHQYFSSLHFGPADSIASEEGRPAHFFTSLHNLAKCVS
ncbi:MAG: DUF3822 family protein [Chitinophagaceae bacterium]|nr:MAG: DUF3822 family protein [Chitinophagaceae bacterium]